MITETEEEQFKIVNLSYTETASIIVRAKDNDEAEEAVFDSFSNVPDLRIISIEDADPDLVEEVIAKRNEDIEAEEQTKRKLN